MSPAPFLERTRRLRTGAGSTFLALENHFNPTLALSGAIRAGGAYSPPENPVLSSLTAEMLDKGTRRRGKLEIAEELESRGIHISFSASGGDPDTMDFSLSCLSRDRDRALSALVEMLLEPAFPADELSREKERLVGGIRQLSDQTGWRASTAASRLIYPPGHPYFAETAEEIISAVEKTTVAELAAFHQKHYRARSLVVAAVGDLDASAIIEDLARRFTPFPGGELEPVTVPPVSAPRAMAETVRMEEKVNADVLLAHDSGLRRTDADYLACTLGVAALGQSTLSSRLGLRVRDTEGLSYGINARVSAGRYSGPTVVSLTVAPENLRRAVASARSVVEEFVRGGITEKELADEKRSRIGKFKVDLASNSGIAGTLDMAETYGLGVSYLDDLPGLIGRITREEVDASVRSHVRPAELVEVAAGTL